MLSCVQPCTVSVNIYLTVIDLITSVPASSLLPVSETVVHMMLLLPVMSKRWRHPIGKMKQLAYH